MSGFASRVPFGRVFSGAGGAGPRRLLMLGGAAVLILGAATAVVLTGSTREQTSTLAKAPKTDPLPGGPRTTPEYGRLALQHDQDLAARAAAAGQSSVASMPGSAVAMPVPREQTPISAVRADPPRLTAAEAGVSSPPPATIRQQTAQAQPTGQPITTQQRQGDDPQAKAYQAAIASMLAGWGSKAQVTEVVLKPEDEQQAAGNGVGLGGGQAGGQAQVQSAAVQGPVPNAPRLGGRQGDRVLMPAGRGVYARTVLAASSDQGGPVVVEALSGPIAGSRMTGGFERREDRLVVRLDSITLPGGQQQRIEALVIAPDSMETSVASSVDQHYGSRFILPVAAAFVSGLGQAIAQSNTAFVAGPLGGVTGFQRLNLGQQLGVGAGVAGAQLGQILKDAAPKGPTVRLDANVNVGVVFLAPVIAPG